MILAGIDIGTNTIRLLVAEVEGAAIVREVSSGRTITRLGEGLDRSAELSPHACSRSLAAVVAFAAQARLQGASRISAIGTSALRNASNAQQFVRSAREAAGVDVQIISGREEARLTLLGVAAALRARQADVLGGAAVVIDIGGGSTEVICREQGQRMRGSSLPLGAVYLTERYVRHDPPRAEEVEAIRAEISAELDRSGCLGRGGCAARPGALIGTAGTITTLAAMAQGLAVYDPERINGYVLTRAAVDGLIRTIAGLTLAERGALKGLERGREDIVLAGALVAAEIMDRLTAASMTVSDGGLREGILLDLAAQIGTADSPPARDGEAVNE